MEREKTKPKGIYKVGNTYYITYYVGAKKYEKAIGSKLSIALKEKMDREKRAGVELTKYWRDRRKRASGS